MPSSVNLLDLPVDILLLIFPYLDARSFLALTSSCQALHSPDFTHNAVYWSRMVRRDFRVPNQPVVQNDGHRWQKLYRRLRTESKVFTWGSNEKGCLGHHYCEHDPYATGTPQRMLRLRQQGLHREGTNWPAEVEGLGRLGIISDMQCGGWSTTLLTAKGELYSCGVLDGMSGPQRPKSPPTALRFPSGYPSPKDRPDPATTIKHFSSGRAHVLALADSGRIWTWHNLHLPGVHVKFLHHETWEIGEARRTSNVVKVVAGWNKSAALIDGTGIVVWEPIKMEPNETTSSDTAVVLINAVVPRTSFRARRGHPAARAGPSDVEEDLAESVGEVLNFIVLEHFILFNTSLGKVFAARIVWSPHNPSIDQPVELPITGPSEVADDCFVTDVQGSFRSFAVFTQSGAVLTSDQDRISRAIVVHAPSGPSTLFTRIPALQHKDVISVAFGDYHFHALHASGHITSYGTEPQSCGALGLGGHGIPEQRLRGLCTRGWRDNMVGDHGYTAGRRVWFEQEKRAWIAFITSGGVDPAEAAQRVRMTLGNMVTPAHGEVSEWIEQQGRDWEEKFHVRRDDDDDGLPAYFALSVAAAGWHSGALVLVNEELAQRVRDAVVVPIVPPPAPVDEPTGAGLSNDRSTSPSASSSSSSSPPTMPAYGLTARVAVAAWTRYLLGLPPDSAASSSAATSTPTHAAASDPNPPAAPGQRPAAVTPAAAAPASNPAPPRNFGASPGEGREYVWAHDHFPRLTLSNGVEMPGEVDFDEWRYGRPEFQLDWERGG